MKLIDEVCVEEKSAGWIVLLALLQLPSLAAFILCLIHYREVHLQRVPQVRLVGKIPLGNTAFWGLLLFAWGFIVCLVGFSTAGDDPFSWLILFLVFIPHALTGVIIALYWAYYRTYRSATEVLLRRIALQRYLLPEDLCIEVLGKQFEPAKTKRMLADLREADALDFDELDDGSVEVRIVSAELAEAMDPFGTVTKDVVGEWECPHCGAPNAARNSRCAYCGGEPNA